MIGRSSTDVAGDVGLDGADIVLPCASATSRLKAPPDTVVVPRLSPASMTPSLSASSNSVTAAPVSPCRQSSGRPFLGDVVRVGCAAVVRRAEIERGRRRHRAVDGDVECVRGRSRADIAGNIGLDGADVVHTLDQRDVEAEGPPDTVVVPRLSPASMTPSLSTSSNSATVAPVSPLRQSSGRPCFLVMLSELDVPLSSAALRSSAVGAATVVSTVMSSA